MNERDAIFRNRLIELMTALKDGENRDPALRRHIGGTVNRLLRDAGAVSWQDLKARADAGTYDSMLRLFQQQSEIFARAGDGKGVRALEALGLSLVARHQQQPDLVPGIGFLDRYIEDCAHAFSRAAQQQARPRGAPH